MKLYQKVAIYGLLYSTLACIFSGIYVRKLSNLIYSIIFKLLKVYPLLIKVHYCNLKYLIFKLFNNYKQYSHFYLIYKQKLTTIPVVF